jgi:predicted amidohydrolase
MPGANLRIATCQFPVSGDLEKNGDYICRYIRKAASGGADIVHFCEAALSGYAGSCPEYGVDVFDVPSFRGFDWASLREKTENIMGLAKEYGIWVVLGSSHYVSPRHKPTNCLYLVSSSGRIRNRYDKSMCTKGDLKAYSPGNRLVTFTIKGVKCGLLICADLGNPNLYHAYKRKGVKVLFHSYYNARFNGPIPNDTWVVPMNKTKAQEYGMWVIANNSSGRHSCWATFIAGPDGQYHSLKRHVSGILSHEIVINELAQESMFSRGKPSTHPRVLDGRSLP